MVSDKVWEVGTEGKKGRSVESDVSKSLRHTTAWDLVLIHTNFGFHSRWNDMLSEGFEQKIIMIGYDI